MTQRVSHIPGPWTYDRVQGTNDFNLLKENGSSFVEGSFVDEDQAADDGTGHILAASLDLRDAVAGLLELVEQMAQFVGVMNLADYALLNEAPLRARRALAKSRGEL